MRKPVDYNKRERELSVSSFIRYDKRQRTKMKKKS
ncbi:hypothetical protein AMURIS_01460 [Acetatifactor muris]|uniref:Uncharacterized protein n=1 Tax=Acetatifactor muris TaxID=879566 RepID=A0A2K4ZE63_9FIRM|nr:hypothetical protein AMURIS_01460 [Acetatifactor muris]